MAVNEAAGVRVWVMVQLGVNTQVPSTHASVVHGLLSLQTMGVFEQVPFTHLSIVQGFPSSQLGGTQVPSTIWK